jgi:hypothetical protein
MSLPYMDGRELGTRNINEPNFLDESGRLSPDKFGNYHSDESVDENLDTMFPDIEDLQQLCDRRDEMEEIQVIGKRREHYDSDSPDTRRPQREYEADEYETSSDESTNLVQQPHEDSQFIGPRKRTREEKAGELKTLYEDNFCRRCYIYRRTWTHKHTACPVDTSPITSFEWEAIKQKREHQRKRRATRGPTLEKSQPFPWQADPKRLTSLREQNYWLYHGQWKWIRPFQYTDKWVELFSKDGFSITTDELAIAKGMTANSDINPTHWFDEGQMWEFLLNVYADPKLLPNGPRFESPKEHLQPVQSGEIYKLSTALLQGANKRWIEKLTCEIAYWHISN